jgi:hypothetical protein
MDDGSFRADVGNPAVCLIGCGFVSQSEELLSRLTLILILFGVFTRTKPVYKGVTKLYGLHPIALINVSAFVFNLTVLIIIITVGPR